MGMHCRMVKTKHRSELLRDSNKAREKQCASNRHNKATLFMTCFEY